VKITNKKVLVAALLIISTIIASFTVLNFVSAQGTTVSVEPPSQEVLVCSTFTIDILISDVTNLDAWEVWVYFDPALMEAMGVIWGPFIPLGDMVLLLFSIDNAAGWVQLVNIPCNGATISGSGIIATIEFHCEAPGVSPITLETQLFDSNGNPIPHNTIPGKVIQREYSTSITYIEPPTITVPICLPFTVDINVKGMTNLHSFSLQLQYSNTPVVDAIDIAPGSFLPSPIVTHKMIDDAAGIIQLDVTAGVANGTSGSGTIATVTFHCTGAGESILTVTRADYYDPAGNVIPTVTTGGRVIQIASWEPIKLIDIVEWPGVVAYVPLVGYVPGTPPGYSEIKAEFESKGFEFVETEIVAMELKGSIGESEFSGVATSWWSHNTLEDGTRACMLSAEMDNETSMAMGFVTNLLPPELVPEVDPYIIVNAQPYLFVRFYWWEWPTDVYTTGRIITWSYWWYDSHSHPNWFWGPYWWWRIHTKAIFRGLIWPPIDINWVYWRPWWGWWWHWIYWRHWHWWSTYFPYDP